MTKSDMIKKNKKESNSILLTAIIIAKNEEVKLPDCLESIKWVNEIILIDSGSTDKTVEIAKKYKAKIFEVMTGSYSDWRNKGLAKATGDWVFYIDADERCSSELKQEIYNIIRHSELDSGSASKSGTGKSRIYHKGTSHFVVSPSQARHDVTHTFTDRFIAYAIPRKNIILGREFKHGGQWPDYQKRLFKRTALKKWSGDLHEQPVIDGKLGHMVSPIIHIKHDNLSDMVTKTNKWSHIEAENLLKSGHPQMVWWRFIRIMMTEGWVRLIKQKGILDGVEGIIYSIYQMWSKFISYGKLWELQFAARELKIKK
jgi:glycosyltransferase involved in cell wall biosynthesis